MMLQVVHDLSGMEESPTLTSNDLCDHPYYVELTLNRFLELKNLRLIQLSYYKYPSGIVFNYR